MIQAVEGASALSQNQEKIFVVLMATCLVLPKAPPLRRMSASIPVLVFGKAEGRGVQTHGVKVEAASDGVIS